MLFLYGGEGGGERKGRKKPTTNKLGRASEVTHDGGGGESAQHLHVVYLYLRFVRMLKLDGGEDEDNE